MPSCTSARSVWPSAAWPGMLHMAPSGVHWATDAMSRTIGSRYRSQSTVAATTSAGAASASRTTSEIPVASRARRDARAYEAIPLVTLAARTQVGTMRMAPARANSTGSGPRAQVITCVIAHAASTAAGMLNSAATASAAVEPAQRDAEEREPPRVEGVVDPEREQQEEEAEGDRAAEHGHGHVRDLRLRAAQRHKRNRAQRARCPDRRTAR